MKEFIDFLGAQPPYDRLDREDLVLLASRLEVEFYPGGTVIVQENDPALGNLYVIRVGAVEIVDRTRVVDCLGPGDTFGHISMLTGLPPALQVRTAEDTLCYRLPDPRGVLAHPERLQFAHYGTMIARERLISSGSSFSRLERPLADVVHPIVWCDHRDPIKTVAAQMTAAGSSCALFVRGGEIGIVTDDDFRRRVAVGEVGVDVPIDRIASVPAITMPADRTVAAGHLFMVERGIHHLVVVDATGRPMGIARVVDMAAAEVRQPLVIRTATANAASMAELVQACHMLTPTTIELADAGIPAEHLGAVLATVIEAIVLKIVELQADEGLLSGLECGWMLMGSLGRRESLPNSDVDTALVWRSLTPDHLPSRTEVAAACAPVIDAFTACGLRPCPQGLNASFPLFNRSTEAWSEAADDWRREPHDVDHLLLASTMLDARPITRPALASPFRSALVAGPGVEDYTRALTRFALTTRPPSGFVRELVIEHFGEQKGYLNLKKAGLRPVAALARALAAHAGDPSGSTPARVDRAHHAGLLTAHEADSLKGAYSLCYQLVVEGQVAALKAGEPVATRVAPASLDRLERRHLRDAFRAINHIQDRFAAGIR
jgi:CBS domain-containing protein